MRKLYYFSMLLIIFAISCNENALGPNEIGGETNLDLSKVGNNIGVDLRLGGQYNGALAGIKDSVFVTKNDGGIVTVHGKLIADEKAVKAIDTLFGTQGLTESTKHTYVDAYLAKFGCKIDTSDHNNMTLQFDAKYKITSEGMQDFTYSNGDVSKPFTMFKYSSVVGDKYEFKTTDGKTITRTVIQKDAVETYTMGFMTVKTIRVEQEMPDDPVIKKVTFIGNHKYGFVGIVHELKNGKIINTTLMPWSVL